MAERKLVAIEGRGGRAVVLRVEAFDDPATGLRASLKALGTRRAERTPRALSIEQARGVLTWPRLTLLRAIRKERPRSVAALARALNRGPAGVQEDLRFLESVGLVTLASPTARSRVRVPQVAYREIQLSIEL
jgi:predicted transcriptional regulator